MITRGRDRHLPEGRDVDDRQRILDHTEEQGSEHRAADGPDAAERRDPADHAGRDRIELETCRDIHIGDRVAGDPKIAAEAREGAGQDEGEEARAADVDAGIERAVEVAAGRVEERRPCA